MQTLTIAMVTIGVLLLISGLFNEVIYYRKWGSHSINGTAVILISILFFLQAFAAYKDSEIQKQRKEKELVIENVTENADEYTFFLDGVEINFENIDINMYDVSFNEETKKVFLTRK